ncbi:NUDIX domain-containing protein [Nonomuraea rhodomycinica]|uniref:NUDIX domain-containing protein n=2 Tax=Nonomuraea rhodomycinica TaxID=1712872 RepID=A0A7Y6IUP2_9ACTN|nr:NUDIX domain-containing protein [Nonomuraea rhodomycinica]
MANHRDPIQRVGAYAICISEESAILLSRFAEPDCRWGPPGGGVEHGEHPADGVVREVHEETGYRVKVVRMLGVHSNVWRSPDAEVHAINLLYEVAVVGGCLQDEIGGSSDQAAWIPLAELPERRRTEASMVSYLDQPGCGPGCGVHWVERAQASACSVISAMSGLLAAA